MAVLEDRVPGKPGRVLVTPEDGGGAFYATLELADEPVVAGNKVNRQNVIDTIIDALEAGTIKTGKIGFAEYVGTGTTPDADNPLFISFDFAPRLVFWYREVKSGINNGTGSYNNPTYSSTSSFYRSMFDTDLLTTEYQNFPNAPAASNNYAAQGYMKKSEDGKTFYWYHYSSTYKNVGTNDSGITYSFIAWA